MTHDPLRPHRHEPNPEPPTPGADFELCQPDGATMLITVQALRAMPRIALHDCFIVSTGHGTSGPFTFAGVRLRDLVLAHWQGIWSSVEVVSADGFGNRVMAEELLSERGRPILLAIERDGTALQRADGLVRLIVPSETEDALRQVKWIATVRVV